MRKDIIKRELKEIISEISPTGDSRFDEGQTLDDLEFDSLDSVEFVLKVEDTFGIEITELDEEYITTKTLGEIIIYIQRKLRK